VRVLLSTYGSRGDVEPLVALAVELRKAGAEVVVCAPPDEDFQQRLTAYDVPMVAVGPSARALTKAAPPPSSMPERAAAVIAGQLEVIPAAAEGCDVLVATGMVPAAAGALSVAEKLGIPAVSVTFQQLTLPAPHRPPLAYAGRPFPPDITDNQKLWELDAESNNALFREALNTKRKTIGLPPIDDVRDYVIGDHPWLASDPTLDPVEIDVVQTGAWILPDDRPLNDALQAFLEDGDPPIYVGFGSMPMHDQDTAKVAIEAIRANGHRVILKSGWADLNTDEEDCITIDEVNQQLLFTKVAAVIHHGGAGTTTTATRAGVPQVVVPQLADQPYWATRVAELGIGVAQQGPMTTESLTTAIKQALTTAGQAKTVAQDIRTDGAAVAARLLLDGSR
jgi:vancomycin aglycone glucosyltransferase